VIGRFVEVTAGLDEVTVTCAGALVAAHERSWGTRGTLTDPVHAATAARLRAAHRQHAAHVQYPPARVGDQVALRALSDYDEIFALGALTMPAPALKAVQ